MAEQTGAGMELDVAQVRKAVQALFAYLKSSEDGSQSLLLNEHKHISLLVTLWKIPLKEQTIHIPLPHGIRTSNAEVCLFTKDEPQMTSEQTEKFYKKLLAEHEVKNITQVIPYKALKKEYKPFEAKRKLLRNFDLFLADDRIRRLLPSQIGKHFYRSKKEPLSVNLKVKQLAKLLDRVIQGTTLPVSHKGCCCPGSAVEGAVITNYKRLAPAIALSTECIALRPVVKRLLVFEIPLPTKGKNIKVLHLKTENSVALPIYCSNLHNLSELDKEANAPDMKQNTGKKGKKSKKKKVRKPKDQAKEPVNGSAAGEPEEKPEALKGKNIKVLHLKTQTSVALPIYCSNLRNLSELDKEANAPDMKQNTGKKGKKSKKKKVRKPKDQAKEPVNGSAAGEPEEKPEEKPEEPKPEVEEIPELVPMETPAKKAKVQKTPKSRKTPAKEPVEKSTKSPEAIRETRLRTKQAQTPVAALVLPETPKAMKKEALQTPSRKAETLKTPKPAVTENGSAPEELQRTPRKRAGPAKVKLAKSAKKVPRTPKRKLESAKVPQSC
ncbi:UNVERIFIED_CONTAM: hypothetical protein FKN15_062226 [Acipenser sinensis]